MKLWLLQPDTDHQSTADNCWEPWYDKAFGFVVAAPNEASARLIAHKNGGDESYKWGEDYLTRHETNAWIDPTKSTCIELKADSYAVPTMILRDFASA